MITIRPAQPNDTAAIVEFNMAMALETEQKKLDPAVLTDGVQAVFDNTSHGFYIVAQSDGKIIVHCWLPPNGATGATGSFGGYKACMYCRSGDSAACSRRYTHSWLKKLAPTMRSADCDCMSKPTTPPPVSAMKNRAWPQASTPCTSRHWSK